MKLIEKVANSAKKDYKNFETGVLSSTERNSIPPPRQQAELNAHTEGPGISGGTVMSQIAAKQRSDVTKVAGVKREERVRAGLRKKKEKLPFGSAERRALTKKLRTGDIRYKRKIGSGMRRERAVALRQPSFSEAIKGMKVPITKVKKTPGLLRRIAGALIRKKVKVA